MDNKYISWRRVSTAKQRGSHLGLEAQKSIIDFFVEREGGELVADYEECHSGTDLAGCAELKKAKAHCKRIGATLVIAKTDRCRDTIEALQLYEEMNGKIYFCDLPHTDKFTLTLFFSLAEREAMIVSLRTKQALAAKRARGEKLGGASEAWQETFKNKTQEEMDKIATRRGSTKRLRNQQSRDMVAFQKVLRKVFPKYTKAESPKDWLWQNISAKQPYRDAMLSLMADYKELDGTLFVKWDFNDDNGYNIQKLRNFLFSFKRSYTN